MSEFNQNGYQNESKGLAIASMILGIVSVVTSCLWFVAGPCGLIGLILGIVSKVKKQGGSGFSTAGIILSVIGLIICLVLLILGAAFLSAYSDQFNY
ncbi:DUF4190 domain-containing protein [Clostridium cellulovorans]|uniref:DUF4190 domain-containing protein n=1 Tax=Clostridium cellulovorans (strain ATCC 35296 / DSM 3052 / OCM 3 / 743B) TaxID=573061 RepID=D9STM8_CLOC7|nr:DUF4190 domain-containing protein [Clostridium cellulovorans]ADL52762.1 hypothetical protein Clocel_3072 [Clostridium cellulovorans 743B]